MNFHVDEKKLKEILLKENYVSASDLLQAEDYAKSHRVSIVEYLLTNGLITKDLLGQALAEFYGVHYADLNTYQPPRERVLKIPEKIAEHYHMVLFDEDDANVIIATDNPRQPGLMAELRRIFKQKNIAIYYSLPEDIEAVFVHYRKSLDVRFVKIIKSQKRIAPEIINEIIEDALAYRASDIHFEPLEHEAVIRFRIDGVLREVGRIDKIYYENILNRIKVAAHLRIDEHASAQDGSIHYVKGEQVVDMRVSVAPTIDGEKIAIRLLSEYVRGFTLSDLGLSSGDQKIIREAAEKPFGMILVTGPTGSGKTTTLYALIKILNTPEVNITTIEDPVEYKIVGVNQIQVNPQTNLTFAAGLRSIARQDPDIILVGEIRDRETAEIAVNAALTGHLLFSTFHANDAATAIPRLLNMGVEPFLVASTLELVIAQRLVRKICENCRLTHSIKKEDLDKLSPNLSSYLPGETVTVYRGKGCSICKDVGYRGRTAVFEFIRITPEMENLILQQPTAKQIWQLARQQGAHSLFEDGIAKVKNGITTIEELLRVAEPPEY